MQRGGQLLKKPSHFVLPPSARVQLFASATIVRFSCRAFPFAPYINSDGDFVGASYYWGFADRCWVISHLYVATPEYLREFFLAYDRLLLRDRDEWRAHRDNSAVMRRVFSRKGEKFAFIGRDLVWRWERPHQGGAIEIRDPARELRPFAPYTNAKTYKAAVKAEGGTVDDALVAEVFTVADKARVHKTTGKTASKTTSKTTRKKTPRKKTSKKNVKRAHP